MSATRSMQQNNRGFFRRRGRGLWGKGICCCLLALLLCISAGCGWQQRVLRIGVVPGMQADFMKAVQREARAQGLDLELVLLQDYSEPNGKLAHGELDAAAFQTQAYLEAECRDRGFAFGVLSRTVLFPVGIYAREPGISLADIPAGAVVQLPRDAVNGSRALRLLEQAGLLRLRPGTGEYASLSDIAENPKALQLVQREGTELPAHFSEADLTVMGTTLAGALELVPCRDALALESADSPYAQVLAVRQTDFDRPEFQQLRSICQSEALRRFIQEQTQGEALPAF